MKIINCIIDFEGGPHYQVGKEKDKVFGMLNIQLKNHDSVLFTVGSLTQFIAVDLYSKINECKLNVYISPSGSILDFQEFELQKAHAYINEEYLKISADLDAFDLFGKSAFKNKITNETNPNRAWEEYYRRRAASKEDDQCLTKSTEELAREDARDALKEIHDDGLKKNEDEYDEIMKKAYGEKHRGDGYT